MRKIFKFYIQKESLDKKERGFHAEFYLIQFQNMMITSLEGMDIMEEIMGLGMVLVMTCMTMITTLLVGMEWEMVMVIMVGITTDGISMDLNTKVQPYF